MTELTKLFQAIFSVIIVSGFYLGFVPALVLEQKLKKAALPPTIAPVYETFQVTLQPEIENLDSAVTGENLSKEEHDKAVDSVAKQSKAAAAPQAKQPTTAAPTQATNQRPVPAKTAQPQKVLTTKVKKPSRILGSKAALRSVVKAALPTPNPQKKRSVKKRSVRKKSKNQCKQGASPFQKTATNKYRLSKKTFLNYARDWMKARSLASLAWKVNKKGSVIGIKITGLRCKSPLQQSGVRRGDIITHIAGVKVTNNRRAFKAYAQSLKYKVIQVKILRRGQEMKINYYLT